MTKDYKAAAIEAVRLAIVEDNGWQTYSVDAAAIAFAAVESLGISEQVGVSEGQPTYRITATEEAK